MRAESMAVGATVAKLFSGADQVGTVSLQVPLVDSDIIPGAEGGRHKAVDNHGINLILRNPDGDWLEGRALTIMRAGADQQAQFAAPVGSQQPSPC